MFVAFWLVLPLRKKERTLHGLVKTYNCVVFKNFQHKMLYSFQNASRVFIVKIVINTERIVSTATEI